jgi:transposase
MDQRTRERLPVLPTLTAWVDAERTRTDQRLTAAQHAAPGALFTAGGDTLRRTAMKTATTGRLWAEDPNTGRRRDLSFEEHRGFWTWAMVEVLRHTGIRIEELTELSHHSLIQYRIPATGELIPLLQITPSKTDTERLLVISPELADVLATIIARIRAEGPTVPLVVGYDKNERVYNPPMPLLFQHRRRLDDRPVSETSLRQYLDHALAAIGVRDAAGRTLRYTFHDFRRLFITDAILHGMPPHIAQLIAGHADINTTMGYKAVYPEEVINGHRAFIARRRDLRPSEEYRTPTDAEWDEFLGHFTHRKVALGECGPLLRDCVHPRTQLPTLPAAATRPRPTRPPRADPRQPPPADHRSPDQPLARRSRRPQGQPRRSPNENSHRWTRSPPAAPPRSTSASPPSPTPPDATSPPTTLHDKHQKTRHNHDISEFGEDVADSVWIADLLAHGLVRASFVPPKPLRDLRDLTRARRVVVEERTRDVQRLDKLLQDAGIKLTSVASKLLGVSGRDMLEEMIAGHALPQQLAELARGRLRTKIPQLTDALAGRFRARHHGFLAAQLLTRIDLCDEQIAELDHRIEVALSPFRQTLERIMTITGVGEVTATVLIAEAGLDMNRFPTAGHLASWAGICPGNHTSGGKSTSGRTRHGNKWLRTALTEAAKAAARSRDTYLASHHAQVRGRRGTRKAIGATRHDILTAYWHIIKHNTVYHELGRDWHARRTRNPEHRKNTLINQLQKLGYTVTLTPTT